jgi:hypothetical protein
LVLRFEVLASREVAWEKQCREAGVEVPEVVRRSRGCKDALEWAGKCPFLVDGWDVRFIPQPRMEKEVKRLNALAQSPPYSHHKTKEAEILDPGEDGLSYRVEDLQGKAQTAVDKDKSTSPSTKISYPSHYPTPKSNIPSSPLPPPSTSTSTLHHPKSVSFSQSLINIPPRPSTTYNRLSPAYTRGRHASSLGTSWADTSFCANEFYSEFGVEDDEEVSSDSREDTYSDCLSEEDEDEDEDILDGPDESGKRTRRRPVFRFSSRKGGNEGGMVCLDRRSEELRERVRDINDLSSLKGMQTPGL